jgi:hypothetical protein
MMNNDLTKMVLKLIKNHNITPEEGVHILLVKVFIVAQANWHWQVE